MSGEVLVPYQVGATDMKWLRKGYFECYSYVGGKCLCVEVSYQVGAMGGEAAEKGSF